MKTHVANPDATDFSKLTVAKVQDIVGRKASDVEVVGEWVVLKYDGVTIRFKKW